MARPDDDDVWRPMRRLLDELTECIPGIQGGDRVFKGTRIMVEDIGKKIVHGISIAELARDYPMLTTKDTLVATYFVVIELGYHRPR